MRQEPNYSCEPTDLISLNATATILVSENSRSIIYNMRDCQFGAIYLTEQSSGGEGSEGVKGAQAPHAKHTYIYVYTYIILRIILWKKLTKG